MSHDRPRLAQAPQRLFVYGSLTFPGVLAVLLGRVPQLTPGAATGWRAAALRDRLFPGLVPAAGGGSPQVVKGQVVAGLSAAEWAILDDFEGPLYDLRRLRLDDGTTAHAYVCTADTLVLDTDWDRAAFAAGHLSSYLSMCSGWLARSTVPGA
ncbi:gamma-glutamylcyclotransferase [Micromonospora sp. ALFpr18c]|uniref:gamma-glutamylcyclotransferase family protein n=1 Tax=Micromonospora sp. ALFpr18c TaxID=1458665 RepID=UPI00124B6FE6|nr:gamma-glutamylcyclotransferase family protein [Micromonospora sp. ALFpr18c]KAB1935303.1 gamma-glutamylcyclotransferase [Micromonospora sp. ALFpr18c]